MEIRPQVEVGAIDKGKWFRFRNPRTRTEYYGRAGDPKFVGNNWGVEVDLIIGWRIRQTTMKHERLVDELPWNLKMPDLTRITRPQTVRDLAVLIR